MTLKRLLDIIHPNDAIGIIGFYILLKHLITHIVVIDLSQKQHYASIQGAQSESSNMDLGVSGILSSVLTAS